jgi:hypothetical protein
MSPAPTNTALDPGGAGVGLGAGEGGGVGDGAGDGAGVGGGVGDDGGVLPEMGVIVTRASMSTRGWPDVPSARISTEWLPLPIVERAKTISRAADTVR